MAYLSFYEKIFVHMTQIYVKEYPHVSFQYFFDGNKYPLIGKTRKIVTVRFIDSKKVFERIFKEGSLGLGESYCEGKIEVRDEDYKELILLLVRVSSKAKFWKKLPFIDLINIIRARISGKVTTRKNQDENINSHYSLSDWFKNDDDSNKFYLYWLNSKYIQYSCARWEEGTKTLEEAQKNKFEYYAKRMGITKESKGKTLLDLGCGWGGLMFYFAEKYGIVCTGVTLSTAQAKYINQEVKKRKMQDKVRVIVDNVHNAKGKFDYVISVGMLEHIADYDDLFKKTAINLKEGGAALMHSMYHESRLYKPDAFLTKYIFPGGATPRLSREMKIMKRYFKTVDCKFMPALSYPKTLNVWFKNFCRNEQKIRKLLEKSKCKNIDFAIRMFKHYLILAECGLTVSGNVFNILSRNPKIK
jgi:cyclopropane-fatty-acyl-phospholipid synthase